MIQHAVLGVPPPVGEPALPNLDREENHQLTHGYPGIQCRARQVAVPCQPPVPVPFHQVHGHKPDHQPIRKKKKYGSAGGMLEVAASSTGPVDKLQPADMGPPARGEPERNREERTGQEPPLDGGVDRAVLVAKHAGWADSASR